MILPLSRFMCDPHLSMIPKHYADALKPSQSRRIKRDPIIAKLAVEFVKELERANTKK